MLFIFILHHFTKSFASFEIYQCRCILSKISVMILVSTYLFFSFGLYIKDIPYLRYNKVLYNQLYNPEDRFPQWRDRDPPDSSSDTVRNSSLRNIQAHNLYRFHQWCYRDPPDSTGDTVGNSSFRNTLVKGNLIIRKILIESIWKTRYKI